MTLSAGQTKQAVIGGVSVGGEVVTGAPQMVLLCKVTFRERVELTDVNVLPFLAECRLRCHRFSYLYQQVLSVPQI